MNLATVRRSLLAIAWVLASFSSATASTNACTSAIPAVQALEAIHSQDWDLAMTYAYWANENNPLTSWTVELLDLVLQESDWSAETVETNRRHLAEARRHVILFGILPNLATGFLLLGLLSALLFRRRLPQSVASKIIVIQAVVLALSLVSAALMQTETLVQSPLELGLRMMPADHADVSGVLPAHTLARIEDERDGYLLLTDGTVSGWARSTAVLTRASLQEGCQ